MQQKQDQFSQEHFRYLGFFLKKVDNSLVFLLLFHLRSIQSDSINLKIYIGSIYLNNRKYKRKILLSHIYFNYQITTLPVRMSAQIYSSSSPTHFTQTSTVAVLRLQRKHAMNKTYSSSGVIRQIMIIIVKPKSNSKSQILVPNPSPKSKSHI